MGQRHDGRRGFGASRKSIGADGVWGSGRSGPGACMLASHVAMGARVGADRSSRTATSAPSPPWDPDAFYDVDLPAGGVVPAGVFMHCVPLNEAAAVGAGVAVGAAAGGARCWTCVVMDVKDEVKSATGSTLLGVPVAEAAARLGLDANPGGAVWAEGEAQTTTLARLFPVRATQQDAAIAALELLAKVRGVPPGTPGRRGGGAGGFGSAGSKRSDKRSDAPAAADDDDDDGLRVSVNEALRVLADHAAMMRPWASSGARSSVRLFDDGAEGDAADTWLDGAPPLRSFVAGPNDCAATATATALELVSSLTRTIAPGARRGGAGGGGRAAGGGGGEGRRRRRRIARSVEARAPAAGRVARLRRARGRRARRRRRRRRRCLRAAVVSPFARAAPLYGRPAAEKAEKAAFFASVMSVLGNGDDDDPGEAPLPPAPAAAAVSRLEKMAAVRAEYPARLNLAGGWTDTPPYSLERRGVVLHVPVLTAYCGDAGTVGSDDGAALRGAISATSSRLRNPVWSGYRNPGRASPVGGRAAERWGAAAMRRSLAPVRVAPGVRRADRGAARGGGEQRVGRVRTRRRRRRLRRRIRPPLGSGPRAARFYSRGASARRAWDWSFARGSTCLAARVSARAPSWRSRRFTRCTS